MKLTPKVLIFLTISIAVMVLVISLIATIVISSNYEDLERQYLEKDLLIVHNKMHDEERSLAEIVSDWAPWDDTYDFINGKKPDYIESNLLPETYYDLHINLIIMTNLTGGFVYSGLYDKKSQSLQEVPPDIISLFGSNNPLMIPEPKGEYISGILILPDGTPMFVVSHPITRSDSSGPPLGNVIMGRTLDAEEVARLADLTNPTLVILPITDPALPSGIRSAVQSADYREPGVVKVLDTDTIAGYSIIKDIYGSDVLISGITNPRDIYRQGQNTLFQFILLIIGSGFIMGIPFVMIPKLTLLSRIKSLNMQVNTIGKEKDLSRRVSIRGDDELSGLASEINQMLGIVEKTHRELEVSEDRYRTLIENANEAIFVVQDGRICFGNQKLEQIGKYTIEELAQKPFLEFVHPDDRTMIGEQHKLRHAGELLKDNYTFRIISKEGSIHWMVISASMITWNGRPAVLVLLSDITERKQAEVALRESEEKFRLISEKSPDHIIIQDCDLRYTSVINPQLGLRPEDMIGKTDYDFLLKEDAEKLTLVKRQVIETGMTVPYETSLISQQGETEYFEGAYLPKYDKEGKIDGLMGYFRNITERKKAEEVLKDAKEYAEKLIQTTNAMIIGLDSNGTITLFNQAAEMISGYTFAELAGRNWFEVIVPKDRYPHVWEEFNRLPTGGFPKNFENPILTKSGQERYIVWQNSEIQDKGQNVGTISFGIDITERKRAEETIRHALAEKEVLLREIHHRVKNNLAGIIALINLQRASLTDPVYISQFKELKTRIRSMAIVHESLSITKDVARVNIASYTENLTRHLFQVYETATGIRCRIDMGDITLPIETTTPCGLVMNEIVTNSLKYAFPDTFSCREIRGEPCTITLTLQRDGSDYLLTVADNGIGIPEGIDVAKTPSLGLYLIRFIVRHQLRGTLEINTAGGTEYTIRFPEPAVKEHYTDEKM
jgi:PAS domain S-box-containing protein